MLEMLQKLIRHKGYANAALLKVIRGHETATQDTELRKLLHHIVVANRYWVRLILGLPFAIEEEARMPGSLTVLAALYQETHEQEMAWLAQVAESELARVLETPFIPDFSCSVAEALMQVCLHSQGHRAQCATRLRELGATPPALDFILWLKDRPAPDWE
jgi:uncharacterized damage-inducible protein DinB